MEKKETKKEAVKDTAKSEPNSLETKGNVTKVKAKMQSKPKVLEKTITKVDLSKPQKTEETNADTKQETTGQVEEIPQVDESKFESAGDDSVVKVDLSKPPTPKEEENETKENNADDSGVAAESKDAEPTQEQEKVQP